MKKKIKKNKQFLLAFLYSLGLTPNAAQRIMLYGDIHSLESAIQLGARQALPRERPWKCGTLQGHSDHLNISD